MGCENTKHEIRKGRHPAHCGVLAVQFHDCGADGSWRLPLPSSAREYRTHITSPGKDQNLKSEVQFLLIVYHFYTHIKSKTLKSNPPALGTRLYILRNKDPNLCEEVSAGDENLGVTQTERVLGVARGSGLLREHLGPKERGPRRLGTPTSRDIQVL